MCEQSISRWVSCACSWCHRLGQFHHRDPLPGGLHFQGGSPGTWLQPRNCKRTLDEWCFSASTNKWDPSSTWRTHRIPIQQQINLGIVGSRLCKSRSSFSAFHSRSAKSGAGDCYNISWTLPFVFGGFSDFTLRPIVLVVMVFVLLIVLNHGSLHDFEASFEWGFVEWVILICLLFLLFLCGWFLPLQEILNLCELSHVGIKDLPLSDFSSNGVAWGWFSGNSSFSDYLSKFQKILIPD